MHNFYQHKPNKVIFWTGAGISKDSPSLLPPGDDLTKEIIDAFCLKGTWGKILNYLSYANIKDSHRKNKTIPRLESILGGIVSVLGYDFLNRFNKLFNPIPNALHLFFAHHILKGGSHITLNLDLGIENALQKQISPPVYQILTPSNISQQNILNTTFPFILHLHGKHGESLSNLGLTIENVSKGFSDDIKKLIINRLHLSSLLIFAGYSGSDFFDVTPFFKELHDQKINLLKLGVVWVDHKENGVGLYDYLTSKKCNPILNALSGCGAQCYIWEGITRYFIQKFASNWGINITPIQNLGQKPSFDKSISMWQQTLVTAKIFVSMGIGKEALSLLKNNPIPIKEYSTYSSRHKDLMDLTPNNRIIYLFNESLREQGLYKQASNYTDMLAKNTVLDELLFLERKASDIWLSGRLFSSKLIYLKALKFGINLIGKSSRFDNLYIECIRGYMQLCRDISRLPIIGVHLSKKYLMDLMPYLKTQKVINSLQSSPYDLSHITRLILWELDQKVIKDLNIPYILTNESNVISVFTETDNILGFLNASRARLRKLLHQKQNVMCDEIHHLYNLSKKIGDFPGIIKATIMLAQTGHINFDLVKDFRHALYQVQWVNSKKIQYVAMFLTECINGALKRIRLDCESE